MNLALRLVLYVGITAGLFGGLASGVWWLVTPDASLRLPVEAQAAPIPPRIAESIERKMPLPVQEPQPVRAVAPPPPPHRAMKVTRGTKSHKKEPPVVQTYVVPVVTTGRTDTPF